MSETRTARNVHQRLALIDAGEDEEGAIDGLGDGGQRGLGQALGARVDSFGFQAELASGEEKLVAIEGLGTADELMAQLLGAGGNIMKAGQGHQAFEAAVLRRRGIVLLYSIQLR